MRAVGFAALAANHVVMFTHLLNHRDDDYVMGHVVYAAWLTMERSFRVNLLTGDTSTSALITDPVQSSIDWWVERFPVMARFYRRSVQEVAYAELRVRVRPLVRRNHPGGGYVESPYLCGVTIIDTAGRRYSAREAAWWYPERTPPQGGASDPQ